MHKLYTSQTANDSTKANSFVASGREVAVHAFGTWDGATVGVYMSLNGTSNGLLLDDLTFTEDGFQIVSVPSGVTIWAQLSSAGGSTDLNTWVSD